ncbi:hypothetical protein V6N11_053880 [Hibiscus sabdariffa]|uniref:Uncharacterized protein n=1 Tax=Hibiscus sabdariffa TaxID=183260 RepID=A0ABR2S2X8_9ROSI
MNKNPNAATTRSSKAAREQAIRTHHARFLSFLHDGKSLSQRLLPTTAVSFITRKAPVEASPKNSFLYEDNASGISHVSLFLLKLNCIDFGRVSIRGEILPENTFLDRSKNSIFGVFDK